MGLKVMVYMLNGYSSNRRYFSLMATADSLLYKTKNLFTSEDIYIYFISDPPHLVETKEIFWKVKATWED